MEDVTISVALEQLQSVLDECFIHVNKPWTYFTDNKPDAGFVGLLQTIDAEEASRKVAGTSIASHVHHILFSLEESSAFVQGDHSQRDWKESWRVSSVNDTEWSRMREDIHKRLHRFKKSDRIKRIFKCAINRCCHRRCCTYGFPSGRH